MVLKLPRVNAMPDPHWPGRSALHALAAEAEAVELVIGVQVARPIRLLFGDPPASLQPHLPGLTPELASLRRGLGREELTAIVMEMGRVMAGIHRVRRPSGPSAISDIPGADPESARLLHMDFHLGNILGRARLGGFAITGVVDWTCCHWGPRELDFAEMGTSVFATNPWALHPFLVGYRNGSGMILDESHIRRVIAADLRRRLESDQPDNPEILRLWTARIHEWES